MGIAILVSAGEDVSSFPRVEAAITLRFEITCEDVRKGTFSVRNQSEADKLIKFLKENGYQNAKVEGERIED